jgi:phycocyanobilin:ferredoxin oxidoreductase
VRSPRILVVTFGFDRMTRAGETFLVEGLGLSPLPLPADLAHASGSWKGSEITIETKAYGSDVVRYARFAVVRGAELQIGNVLCLPQENHPLPILGADLVGVRAGTGMVAADLSPTLPPGVGRDSQLALLAERRAGRPSLPSGGALPDWCTRWFSPHYLYTRGSAEALQGIEEAFHDFVEIFATLARDSIPHPEQASDIAGAQRGYLEAHLTDDKGLNLLGAMFGKEWSQRYIGEVLFPVSA